jgi:hypothetical protein
VTPKKNDNDSINHKPSVTPVVLDSTRYSENVGDILVAAKLHSFYLFATEIEDLFMVCRKQGRMSQQTK